MNLKNMKQSVAYTLVVLAMCAALPGEAKDWQGPNDKAPAKSGKVTGKTVGAGALSLLIWPGIGQAVNDNKGSKVATHALLGLLPPYRLWSGYDALVNRQGGYWNGKI